jgi:hypothetical protein
LSKTILKNVTFIWGEGEWKWANFQNVFGDGPIKVAHYHKKKTLKTFVLVDAPKCRPLGQSLYPNNHKYRNIFQHMYFYTFNRWSRTSNKPF